ncbi:argininosuccinate lyase [Elongatibacter sediminis]|uniref:Argininosuccinate lyase n=1 Tax=Elongatibacter sediminis TaxID=3119006 RepID=A0AAW9RGK2_9GAMM
MSNFLWGAQGTEDLDRAILAFTAGEDVVLDRELFVYDLTATAAHVRGLSRIGILEEAESKRLCELLETLRQAFERGEFVLDEGFEDGHSAIEAFLTEHAGPLGERVHTGRSRNDQVAVAARLYMRDRLGAIARDCVAVARACLEQARRHEFAPMPGYTHLQRAVPSSVGLWMGGFAESFGEDVAFIAAVLELLDACPLGTAAGYGVNLPLDRDGVAAELDFARLQVNPLATQNARGKSELMALQAVYHPMQDLRRLAWDLSLYTTAEFAFVRLPARYTTGSSIMPNKSNPDVVELMRARVATVEGALHEIQSVLSLPSGYQRDLQLTKGPMIRGLQAAATSMAILPPLLDGLEFDTGRMRDAVSPDMFATDLALEIAASGVPFREAYRTVKEERASLADRDAVESLRQRTSPGAAGALRLDEIEARLDAVAAPFG